MANWLDQFDSIESSHYFKGFQATADPGTASMPEHRRPQ